MCVQDGAAATFHAANADVPLGQDLGYRHAQQAGSLAPWRPCSTTRYMYRRAFTVVCTRVHACLRYVLQEKVSKLSVGVLALIALGAMHACMCWMPESTRVETLNVPASRLHAPQIFQCTPASIGPIDHESQCSDRSATSALAAEVFYRCAYKLFSLI